MALPHFEARLRLSESSVDALLDQIDRAQSDPGDRLELDECGPASVGEVRTTPPLFASAHFSVFWPTEPSRAALVREHNAVDGGLAAASRAGAVARNRSGRRMGS